MRAGVFQETSVLINKTLKAPVLSSIAKEITDPRHVFSGASTYSILEYYKTVILGIDIVVNKLRTNTSLGKARERFNTVTAASRDVRKIRICTAIFDFVNYWIEENFDPFYMGPPGKHFHLMQTKMAVTTLEQFKMDWHESLKLASDSWVNGTKCWWAQHLQFEFPSLKSIKCSRSNQRCNLVHFLTQKKAELQIIKTYVDSLNPRLKHHTDNLEMLRSNELAGVSAAIAKFLTDPDSAADYKTGCIKFADTIIALEAESFQLIYSANPKEFRSLCHCLKKDYIYQHHAEREFEIFIAPNK